MGGPSRYYVSEKAADLDNGILENIPGITDQTELEDAETALLADAYEHFLELITKSKVTFDLAFIYSIHAYFLGPLYSWAGTTRTVDISKDDMLFAPVQHIDTSLTSLDSLIQKYLPNTSTHKTEVAKKLAIIHNECNVAHPFREGNGRTIRLYLDLVAVSIGFQPIDWSSDSIPVYIDACKAGVHADHIQMTHYIQKGLST